MSDENVSLESILQDYFGCKHPVLQRSVPTDYDGYDRRYLTRSGQRAYSQMIGLLYDLAELLDMPFDEIIEELDEIADGRTWKLQADPVYHHDGAADLSLCHPKIKAQIIRNDRKMRRLSE